MSCIVMTMQKNSENNLDQQSCTFRIVSNQLYEKKILQIKFLYQYLIYLHPFTQFANLKSTNL